MKKTFVLMTRSYKFGGYCVAGIEIVTKKWIRLVSSSDPSKNEIPKSIFDPYDDLDILEVEVTQEVPYACQSENFLLAPGTMPVRRGRFSFYELLNPVCLSTSPALFGNELSYLTEDEIARQRSSLGLFKVDALRFDYFVLDDKMHYRSKFLYKGKSYSGVSVTDPVFRRDEFAGQSIDHALIVVSLPALPYPNGNYYKFIAKIFPLTEEETRLAEDSLGEGKSMSCDRAQDPDPMRTFKEAAHFLLALADGRDPDTGGALDPTRVLSPSYAARLRLAAGLIGRRPGKDRTEKPNRKLTYLLRENVEKIEISEDPVTVSVIRDRVNAVREPYGKALPAHAITEFFIEAGMLEVSPEYKNRKLPTARGKEYGVIAEQRRSSKGFTYFVLFYGERAQRFLIDNLERCVELCETSRDVAEKEPRSANDDGSPYQPWTEEEDLQLKSESEAGMGIPAIAKLHNRSAVVVRSRLLALGFTRGTLETDKRWERWSQEEEKELVEQFLSGQKIGEIAKLHGRSGGGIRARLKRLGYLTDDEGGKAE